MGEREERFSGGQGPAAGSGAQDPGPGLPGWRSVREAAEALRVKDLALHFSLNAIALSDLEGTVTDVNPSFLALWGYGSAEEVLGRRATGFWESQAQAESALEALRERGRWQGELTALRSDGRRVPVELSAAVLTDDDGRPLALAASFVDVSGRRAAEEELRRSEARYRDLVEDASVWIWETDATLRHVYSNAFVSTCLGYTAEEFLAADPRELVHPDDRPSLDETVAAALREGTAWSGKVFRWRHRDGSWRDLESSGTRVLDDRGDPRGLRGIDHDVTERRRAELSLRRGEERLRFVLSQSPAVVYTCRPTGDFGATFVSPNVAEMLGYDPEQFVREPGFWASRIHPDDAPRVFGGLGALFAQGRHSHEYRFRHRDGTWRWMRDDLRLLRDAGGEPLEIIGSWLDVTERKEVERQLRASEEQLRVIFDTSQAGIILVDPEGRIVLANRRMEEMFGVPPGGLAGTRYPDHLHESERASGGERMRRLIRGEIASVSLERRYVRADGTPFWGYLSGKRMENPDGSLRGLLGIIADITEQKHAEEERLALERRLLHAQKLESLGVLAGGIAHDFNNLLMAILGNLDLALLRTPPSAPARECIQRSAQAARRATDLTRQMLAYSGRGSFLVEPVDVNALVEENAELFRAAIPRSATLTLRLARPLPPIEADAGQVQQVLMNLLTNAAEALEGAPGVITLATGVREYLRGELERSRIEDLPPEGPFVCLEVADTGRGMDEETRQRLFDPFFTTKRTGRGLGLSAILGIVRGHRGAIFVDSAEGQGTAVRILFPLGAESASRGEAREAPPSAPAETSRPRGVVLVVDDEEGVREVCRDMLEHLGWRVLTAPDGREAVRVFGERGGEISAVILDLSMPVMDGMTALRELLRLRPDATVILSSGFDGDDALRDAAGARAAGFIQKPYTVARLRQALEAAGG